MGAPTIGARVGGITESIRDEENGLLYDFRDSAGLTAQMRRVLTEPGLYERLQAGLSRTDRHAHDGRRPGGRVPSGSCRGMHPVTGIRTRRPLTSREQQVGFSDPGTKPLDELDALHHVWSQQPPHLAHCRVLSAGLRGRRGAHPSRRVPRDGADGPRRARALHRAVGRRALRGSHRSRRRGRRATRQSPLLQVAGPGWLRARAAGMATARTQGRDGYRRCGGGMETRLRGLPHHSPARRGVPAQPPPPWPAHRGVAPRGLADLPAGSCCTARPTSEPCSGPGTAQVPRVHVQPLRRHPHARDRKARMANPAHGPLLRLPHMAAGGRAPPTDRGGGQIELHGRRRIAPTFEGRSWTCRRA